MTVRPDRRNICHLSCVRAAKGMATRAVLSKDRAPALCRCLVDREGIGHWLQRKQEIGHTRETGLDDGTVIPISLVFLFVLSLFLLFSCA